jgi:hypothetical protein
MAATRTYSLACRMQEMTNKMQAVGLCDLVDIERRFPGLRRREDLQICWTNAGKLTDRVRSS